MTNQASGEERDFHSAVSQAAQSVADRKAAEAEAAERQKPKPRGPILIALLVGLVVVVVYDIIALNADPVGLPDDEVAESLRFSVGTLADEIELYRVQEGRLPTPDDLVAEDLLNEDIIYVLHGETYTITATDEVVTVTYESTTPLIEWVETGGGAEW